MTGLECSRYRSAPLRESTSPPSSRPRRRSRSSVRSRRAILTDEPSGVSGQRFTAEGSLSQRGKSVYGLVTEWQGRHTSSFVPSQLSVNSGLAVLDHAYSPERSGRLQSTLQMRVQVQSEVILLDFHTACLHEDRDLADFMHNYRLPHIIPSAGLSFCGALIGEIFTMLAEPFLRWRERVGRKKERRDIAERLDGLSDEEQIKEVQKLIAEIKETQRRGR